MLHVQVAIWSLTKKNYVKYSLLWSIILENYGTMELWLTMENCGTMEKTMILWRYYVSMDKNKVLYRNIWNFDLRREKYGGLQKTVTLWFKMKKKNPKGLYTKTIEFFKQIHNIWTLVYYVKTMAHVLWKKLKYNYSENYCTIQKTLKPSNFDLLCRKTMILQ